MAGKQHCIAHISRADFPWFDEREFRVLDIRADLIVYGVRFQGLFLLPNPSSHKPQDEVPELLLQALPIATTTDFPSNIIPHICN